MSGEIDVNLGLIIVWVEVKGWEIGDRRDEISKVVAMRRVWKRAGLKLKVRVIGESKSKKRKKLEIKS